MNSLSIAFLSKPGFGNIVGLAYSARTNCIYLAHSSHTGPKQSLIYALDLDGVLIGQSDFTAIYPDTLAITSLSYDRRLDHIFVGTAKDVISKAKLHVVEVTSDVGKILLDTELDYKYSGICVRDDAIWSTNFSEDKVSQFTMSGQLLAQVSLNKSFGGHPGPCDIAPSFGDGFFVLDHFRKLLIEIDPGGNEIRAISTASLGDGRGFGIDTDRDNRRLFVSVNNEQVFILEEQDLNELPKSERCARRKDIERNYPDDVIDVSKLPNPESTPWTRAKARKVLLKVVGRFRDQLPNATLDPVRLPRWVTAATIRFGWIRNSLVFVFEESDTQKDKYDCRGRIHSDTALLCDIKVDSVPTGVMIRLEEGARQITYASYGNDGDRAHPPIVQLSADTAFCCCGYMVSHGPIAILDHCFQLVQPRSNAPAMATRIVPAAFYISWEDLQDEERVVEWIAQSLLHHLKEIEISDRGSAFQEIRRRIETIEAIKASSVIVLGSFSDSHKRELIHVRDTLKVKGYDASLITDFPDLPSMSTMHKVELWAKAARFCVMIDREPSGHVAEYDALKRQQVVLALLRQESRGSTVMIGVDHLVDVNYIKLFEFRETPMEVLDSAVEWAERFIEERVARYADGSRGGRK